MYSLDLHSHVRTELSEKDVCRRSILLEEVVIWDAERNKVNVFS